MFLFIFVQYFCVFCFKIGVVSSKIDLIESCENIEQKQKMMKRVEDVKNYVETSLDNNKFFHFSSSSKTGFQNYHFCYYFINFNNQH